MRQTQSVCWLSGCSLAKAVRPILLVLFGVSAVTLAGCGQPSIVVEGELRLNQQPYKLKDGDEVNLVLVGAAENGQELWTSGTYDAASSTFRFAGNVGKGVQPGDYKLGIRIGTYQSTAPDRFQDQFAVEKTPLTVSVTGDRSVQRIVVDLGAKTVSTVK
jgi:hypothetical protein